MVIMGVSMSLTALFIFYSPVTSPSGSHINPAVTITLWRLGKIDKWNALFYILFQFIGGTAAVYIMAGILKGTVTDPPVNYAATVPGRGGALPAFITEFAIAFVMMIMNLFTSSNKKMKKFTRIITACFICIYVIVAGPVSGFGMNPARSFASAFPSHTWTAFWIYLFVPVGSMLLAAECFLYFEKRRLSGKYFRALQQYLRSNP
jgi:aquaporin Z